MLVVAACAGNDLLREGDVEGAVSRYSAAIDAAPTGVQAHVLHANRAAAYTRLGKHEQALEDGQYVPPSYPPPPAPCRPLPRPASSGWP